MSEYRLGNKSAMSVGEITASYRQAKDKKAQIQILAELCGTDKDEIKKILRDVGYIDKNGNPNPSAFIKDSDMPDIERMRKDGLPLATIAKKFGVTGQTITNRLKAWKEAEAPAETPDNEEEKIPASDCNNDDTEKESSSRAVKAAVLTLEDLNRKRFMDGLEIDKDFYKAVLEVYDLLRWIVHRYPGVHMVCMADKDGSVIASGEFQDLLAEFQGGGPVNGESEGEQG
jgi:hypothetical protein